MLSRAVVFLYWSVFERLRDAGGDVVDNFLSVAAAYEQFVQVRCSYLHTCPASSFLIRVLGPPAA
jgi:hypothetical protein